MGKPSDAGYVYFVLCKDGYIKIGRTSRILARIKEIRSKNGAIKYLNIIHVSNMRDAERALHEGFDDRHHGTRVGLSQYGIEIYDINFEYNYLLYAFQLLWEFSPQLYIIPSHIKTDGKKYEKRTLNNIFFQ
jgi:hypothetical protein